MGANRRNEEETNEEINAEEKKEETGVEGASKRRKEWLEERINPDPGVRGNGESYSGPKNSSLYSEYFSPVFK